MHATTFVTLWLLHAAALLTPGANSLLVTHLAASGHVRSAAFAAVGVTVGAAAWSGAAVLGVGALFAAFPAVRLLLQVAGAVYLLHVALRMWRSGGPSALAGAPSLSPAAAVRAGLLTNLSNPKSAFFFGSIFSAALPSEPTAVVLLAAVLLIVINALCWHLLLAVLFSRPVVRAGYARQKRLFARLAGAVVGGLGLSLLFASLTEARRAAS
jgi:threonine/homoserine/homoserine lactone efflux protein